jgi:hypothetical protein
MVNIFFLNLETNQFGKTVWTAGFRSLREPIRLLHFYPDRPAIINVDIDDDDESINQGSK